MKRKYYDELEGAEVLKIVCAACTETIVCTKEELAGKLPFIEFGCDLDEMEMEREEGLCKPWVGTGLIGKCRLPSK